MNGVEQPPELTADDEHILDRVHDRMALEAAGGRIIPPSVNAIPEQDLDRMLRLAEAGQLYADTFWIECLRRRIAEKSR